MSLFGFILCLNFSSVRSFIGQFSFLLIWIVLETLIWS